VQLALPPEQRLTSLRVLLRPAPRAQRPPSRAAPGGHGSSESNGLIPLRGIKQAASGPQHRRAAVTLLLSRQGCGHATAVTSGLRSRHPDRKARVFAAEARERLLERFLLRHALHLPRPAPSQPPPRPARAPPAPPRAPRLRPSDGCAPARGRGAGGARRGAAQGRGRRAGRGKTSTAQKNTGGGTSMPARRTGCLLPERMAIS
jgi:hypothetical protein